MDTAKRHALLFNRDRFADLVPVLAYNDDENLFYMDGDRSYLGSVFLGHPLIGADDRTTELIKASMTGDVPDDTIIQFSYVSTSFIDSLIQVYSQEREDLLRRASNLSVAQRRVLHGMYKARRDFLKQGAEEAIVKSSGVRLKHTLLVVSIKIPVSKSPSDREVEDTKAAVLRFHESLKSVGLNPNPVNASLYLMLVRSMLFMGKEPERWYDDDRLIKEQIMPYSADMEVHKDFIRVGDNCIRSLSVQNYPDQISLAQFNRLIGDPAGSHNQIVDPFILTLTVYIPAQSNEIKSIKQKKATIDYQSEGRYAKWVAKIGRKAEGFQTIEEAMEDGNRPVRVWNNLLIFSKNPEQSGRSASQVRTHFQMEGFEMHEDKHMHSVFTLATLPLFPEVSNVTKSQRFYTMTTREACQLTPVIGEWVGSGSGSALALAGRRGQVMLFDLFDSQTNYNCVIAAESGAGKSFLANDIIASYLQKGGMVRVIDQGRSYQKLTESIEGQYIEFGDQPISLNPFTHIQDIDEEMSLLQVIIAKMASPNEGFNDWQMAQVQAVVKDLWDELGNDMTITDVQERFQRLADDATGNPERYSNIAEQLNPFSRHGPYGVYFDKKNNLNYNNNLVVLELDNLRSKRDLQQVVLLQLIAQLQTECYQGDRNVPKIIVIDEAWEMFEDPMVAKFLEGAYRRFRKYNSACVVVTQSLDDLYNSASGEAIAKNSANLIVLRQNSEAIEGLKRSERFQIGAYGFEMMKSLHTERGQYSDVLCRSGDAWGVARFVVDRYTQLLYSTAPDEVSAIDELKQQGLPVHEAIEALIKIEQGETPNFRKLGESRGPQQSDGRDEIEGLVEEAAVSGG